MMKHITEYLPQYLAAGYLDYLNRQEQAEKLANQSKGNPTQSTITPNRFAKSPKHQSTKAQQVTDKQYIGAQRATGEGAGKFSTGSRVKSASEDNVF